MSHATCTDPSCPHGRRNLAAEKIENRNLRQAETIARLQREVRAPKPKRSDDDLIARLKADVVRANREATGCAAIRARYIAAFDRAAAADSLNDAKTEGIRRLNEVIDEQRATIKSLSRRTARLGIAAVIVSGVALILATARFWAT